MAASSLLAFTRRALLRPIRVIRSTDRSTWTADALAGLTVTVILLPQAIAFALIAGLPPSVGLYTAIVGAVVGALWGSSPVVQNGPTSAVSLLVLSTLAASFPEGSTGFLAAAGLLAVMAGVLQIGMGIARLGVLVTFVSEAVIVGFSAGAGILIAVGEIRHLMGLPPGGRRLVEKLEHLAVGLPDAHVPTVALGFGTLTLLLAIRRWRPGWPAALLGLVLASGLLAILNLDARGVAVLGTLPRTPPLPQAIPLDAGLIGALSTGALAVAAIGLIQTMAVAKSLDAPRGERLDANQEFVGQGLANVACGFFGGYPASGSFSRSAVNVESGAQTGLASAFSGVFLLSAMVFLGDLTAYLPRAALAAVLLIVAAGMIDVPAIRRIVRGAPGETAIMGVTLLGTLFLPIEFAVLTGILMSLGNYIRTTTAPQVQSVLPDDTFQHFVPRPDRPACPQLGILDIHGDLYFGATTHVEEAIQAYGKAHPTQRFLLLRMRGVNHCDFSGIRMLESIVRAYRARGGDVYLTRLNRPVLRFMIQTEFHAFLGRDHFLAPDGAIEHLFHHVLDPAVCIYESNVRAFKECQTLPRPDYAVALPVLNDLPDVNVPSVSADALWAALHGGAASPWPSQTRPRVVDVREPREYRQGHVPGAILRPFPDLLARPPAWDDSRPVVLVCRGGRRSHRAACLLLDRGRTGIHILRGGMLAWEAADRLEAVGTG